MKWSEKKNPFKVGDKIKYILHPETISTGIISEVSGELVSVNGVDRHWRLCKKLKPKRKPREIWVNYYWGRSDTTHFPTEESANHAAFEDHGERIDCVLFREVLKK